MENQIPPSTKDLTLESKLRAIVKQLEQVIEEHPIVQPQPFQKIINELTTQVSDVVAIEESMNSIRREITEPVKIEIEKTSKLGKFSMWGFWVGIVGGLFAIGSIAMSMYWNYENSESSKKFMENTRELVSSMKANNDELNSIIKEWDEKRLAKIESDLERLEESMKISESTYGLGSSTIDPSIVIDLESIKTQDITKDLLITDPSTLTLEKDSLFKSPIIPEKSE